VTEPRGRGTGKNENVDFGGAILEFNALCNRRKEGGESYDECIKRSRSN